MSNKNKILNVLDNCDAFIKWLDENKIPYIRNGHYTSFDLDKVDVWDVAKRFGVFEDINKPKK